MSATLHINKSETQCAECGAYNRIEAVVCVRCGETFTHIGSGYLGLDKVLIMSLRPDLEPNFYEPVTDDELAQLRTELDAVAIRDAVRFADTVEGGSPQ